ncbi:HAMP domain-containing protein [Roseomonas sp. PWR1]|uniref:HAMP domain-containing protein n=1 Tax=Roseomonas nitratireducens TaxID=2820810 RepID=A0ABS4AUR4_9PROT|nr:methyl-accepting chemotaxis protein [Neoroseomonas nitratireducens]MBP0465100.1 HAMP domain-containing protein [Neoroseomonas nitratireducens]
MLLVAVLSVGGAGWAVRTSNVEMMDEALTRSLDRAEAELAAVGLRMRGHAAGLAARPDVVRAVGAADSAAARDILVAAFEALRAADPAVAVIEATDAAGRVLIRGHNPGRAGDDKSRAPDVAAALAGRPAVGNEVSPTSGAIAIGAVLPLRGADGRVVGTIRVGSNPNAALATEIGQGAGGVAALFGAGRLVAASLEGLTADALPPAALAAIRSGAAMNDVSGVLPGRGNHLVGARPIRDLAGQAVGTVMIAMPTQRYDAQESHVLWIILACCGVVILLALPLAVFAARRIAGPLAALGETMGTIAGGRTDVAVPGIGRQDEIGGMARALETFRLGLEEKARLNAAAAAEQAARARRQAAIERHTEEFGRSIAGVMDQLRDAAGGMRNSAGEMAKASEGTRAQAESTAAGAEESSRNLASVAAATEELTVSVSEISRQVAAAASAAREAVDRAEATGARVQGLSEAAGQIGDVVRLISGIAGQTNLLALNATIEAARAGEAGKGFAVVASEVKTLATETARATEQIGQQVAAIQAATLDAVGAVAQVGTAIGSMNEVASAIAAAVEEQGAATREIAASVQTVARQNNDATQAMHDVSSVAATARGTSGTVLEAAEGLARIAGTLREEVDQFLAAMRADESDRRRYERIPARGMRVGLRGVAATVEQVELFDVSRGGAALVTAHSVATGTDITIMLPDGMGEVGGRVVYCAGGRMGVVLRQDAASLTRIDRLLDRLQPASMAAAA